MRKRIMTAAAIAGLLFAAAANAVRDIGYEAKADPFAVVATAVKQAAAEKKLVLVIAGGDWCIWCHYLYDFLEGNDDINGALHELFVIAKVYKGDDNENKEFYATLPKAAGYPHFWILGSDGKLLQSQDTVVLEDGGKSYDRVAWENFLARWRERGP